MPTAIFDVRISRVSSSSKGSLMLKYRLPASTVTSMAFRLLEMEILLSSSSFASFTLSKLSQAKLSFSVDMAYPLYSFISGTGVSSRPRLFTTPTSPSVFIRLIRSAVYRLEQPAHRSSRPVRQAHQDLRQTAWTERPRAGLPGRGPFSLCTSSLCASSRSFISSSVLSRSHTRLHLTGDGPEGSAPMAPKL